MDDRKPKTAYPNREPFFAYRYCRLITKTCAAQEIGQAATLLCMTIALVEDAKRYSGYVTYYNEQLMPVVGFNQWRAFDRARRQAVAAGWLHYESGEAGKRKPGRYWVTIPTAFEGLDDSPCDESDSLLNSTDDRRLAPIVAPNDKRKAPNVAPNVAPNYLPIPNPIPKKEEAPPSAGSFSSEELGGKEDGRAQAAQDAPTAPSDPDEPPPLDIDQAMRRFWQEYPAEKNHAKTRSQMKRFLAAGKDFDQLMRAVIKYKVSGKVRAGYITNPDSFIADGYLANPKTWETAQSVKDAPAETPEQRQARFARTREINRLAERKPDQPGEGLEDLETLKQKIRANRLTAEPANS